MKSFITWVLAAVILVKTHDPHPLSSITARMDDTDNNFYQYTRMALIRLVLLTVIQIGILMV